MDLTWKNVRGTQSEKPKEIEICKSCVYLRRNIHKFTESDTMDETRTISGWEYEEICVTQEQYKIFATILGNPFYFSKIDELNLKIADLEEIVTMLTK